MISRLRGKSKGVAAILAMPFVYAGFSPLAVSLLAIPLALSAAFFIIQQQFLLAFFFALLAVLMDLIDGAVARVTNRALPFGSYIEGVIDKAVDFILLGSFVLLFPLAAVFALGFSFLVSFAKPRVALVIVTDNRDWPGIGERGDKFVILLFGLLVSAFYPVIFGFNLLEYVLYLVALVSFAGLLQRISYANRLIKEAEAKGNIISPSGGCKNK